MSQTIAEPAVAPAPIKFTKPAEKIAEATTEALAKGSAAVEKTLKENAATLAESGTAASTAFQELTKAYQELAVKNAKNLAAAIQSISSVKSIPEFIELEQKLIKEGVENAVSDSKNIARLTAAVFAAAFDPIKNRIESIRK